MAATCTLKGGPVAFGGSMAIAHYEVALDNSYPTGGEAIDLTGEFDYVWAILIGGNDTSADNAYLYQGLHPGPGTANTSSNTLIQAFWSADGTDGEPFVEVTNTTDLSAVGGLQVTVIGVSGG